MLIAFEGSSASGKSTLVREVTDQLKKRGLEVHDIKAQMAQMGCLEHELAYVIQHTSVSIDPVEELLLYATRLAYKARLARSFDQDQKNIVIVDRYYSSLLALSHYARGLPRQRVNELVNVAIRDYWPDAIIFLDISYADHVRRGGHLRTTRVGGQEHFEQIRYGFLQEFKKETRPKLFLETASMTIDQSTQHILRLMSSLGSSLL